MHDYYEVQQLQGDGRTWSRLAWFETLREAHDYMRAVVKALANRNEPLPTLRARAS